MAEKTVGEALEQIAKLDRKLGVGVGAVKERAKLQQIIDVGNSTAKNKVTRRGKRAKR